MSTDAQFNAVRNEQRSSDAILWVFVLFLALDTQELSDFVRIVSYVLIAFWGFRFGWYTVKMWRSRND